MQQGTDEKGTTARIYNILSVWLGALFLCIPAFINGFPFLFADTGTYLVGGFQGIVSDIRPITYGVFMRHASLMESFWLVILLQGLFVSWVIHLFFAVFSRRPVEMRPLICIGLLTLVTGIGEVAGMLMPDIFASLMILCSIILLFAGPLKTWKWIVLTLLFGFSVASHHSNAYIMFGVLLCLILLIGFSYLKKISPIVPLRRFGLVFAITLVGYFTIPALHWKYGGEFFWSKSKSVFLTNRINQMGLLKPFLREHCATASYNLCGSIDQIPYDFLWDTSSPMYKNGGMAANDPFYSEMLGGFFSDPYYVKKFAIKSVENGVIQFFNFEGKLIYKEIESGYPFQVFQEILPEFINSIKRSEQYADRWDSRNTQLFQRFAVMAGWLLLLGVLIWRWPYAVDRQVKLIILVVLLSLAANAFVCGGISMVDMRFQHRVIWIVPLVAFWIWTDYRKVKE
jgi:hypothetical protein